MTTSNGRCSPRLYGLKNIKTFQRSNFGLDNYNFVMCVSYNRGNLGFSIILSNLVQFAYNGVNLPYK